MVEARKSLNRFKGYSMARVNVKSVMFDLLTANPNGMMSGEIIRATGWDKNQTSTRLRDLFRRGHIQRECDPTAPGSTIWRWFLPNQTDAVLSYIQSQTKARDERRAAQQFVSMQKRRAVVIEVLRKLQPTSASVVATHLGWSRWRVAHTIGGLSRDRLVVSVGIGPSRVWGIYGDPVMLREQRRLDSKRARAETLKKQQEESTQNMEPVQMVVPAHIRPTPAVSTRSVFEWRP